MAGDRRRRHLDTAQHLHPLRRLLRRADPVAEVKAARDAEAPGIELALLRDSARGVSLRVHQLDALAGQRGYPLRRASYPRQRALLPVAIDAAFAPPVDLALLGKRERVAEAGGDADEPQSSFRQSCDPPGQHLAFQRAMTERAVLAVPKGIDCAGVGHRQAETVAEGDTHYAIFREPVLSLWS